MRQLYLHFENKKYYLEVLIWMNYSHLSKYLRKGFDDNKAVFRPHAYNNNLTKRVGKLHLLETRINAGYINEALSFAIFYYLEKNKGINNNEFKKIFPLEIKKISNEFWNIFYNYEYKNVEHPIEE